MSSKYPRTSHLPWSPGMSNDDRMIESLDLLLREPTVITEKLDGSNLCMTQRNIYARSHSRAPVHPSFDLAKQMHAAICYSIPENESWFFEWTYAVHSIEYAELPSYLHLIGIRDDDSMVWKSWRGVELTAENHGLTTVPVLAERSGTIMGGSITPDATILQAVTEKLARMPSVYGPTREGVVIRLKDAFQDEFFHLSVAKWVRPNHVQTDDHWTNQEIRKQPVKHDPSRLF